jgi:hypothetical protein
MPQTFRLAYWNLMIELIWEFVNVDIDQPDAEPVQMQAYIDLHMLTHAVARRLYPGENDAGDMAAYAAALRDRIAKVKRSRHELVTLWHEAVTAADDATQRRSQSQRMTFDVEAKKVKDIARAQAFAEQASYRRAVRALMAGSPGDLRDSAVLALIRALNPDAERPAVRAPLKKLLSTPKITMTALKKAARKMDVCSAAGPDNMPVLHVSGLMRSTTGDAGVTRSRRLFWRLWKSVQTATSPRASRVALTRLSMCPSSRTPRAAPQEGCGRWPSGRSFEDLRPYWCSARHFRLQTDYLLPHQVSTVAAAGTEILMHGFREKLQFGHDPGKVALRVDAANAFNAVSWDEILERVCDQAPPAARFFHALYGEPPYVVAGTTLLLSREGNQPGDPLGMLLFALTIQPPVLRIQSECDLEPNLWYADDDTLVGSVSEVAKMHQIIKDEGPKYCFFLVPHKTSLWWLTMDCVRLWLLFECRLDVDVNDLPLPGIVLVGSPVGSDEFVKQHLSAKSAKVDVVLGMIADMDNA